MASHASELRGVTARDLLNTEGDKLGLELVELLDQVVARLRNELSGADLGGGRHAEVQEVDREGTEVREGETGELEMGTSFWRQRGTTRGRGRMARVWVERVSRVLCSGTASKGSSRELEVPNEGSRFSLLSSPSSPSTFPFHYSILVSLSFDYNCSLCFPL